MFDGIGQTMAVEQSSPTSGADDAPQTIYTYAYDKATGQQAISIRAAKHRLTSSRSVG